MPFPPSGQTATLASYRSEVRFLLHDATGNFWADSELNGYINSGRFRTASDTGCLRSLVTANLSTGLENYPIGGVTGGLITNTGVGYSFMNVAVSGDGNGATAIAKLLPATTALAGGQVLGGYIGNAGIYASAPTITLSGPGSGAAMVCYLSLATGLQPVIGSAGYVVGDILTLQGGTFVTPATLIVVSVGGSGNITGGFTFAGGTYTVAPVGPVTLTGGHGTGASLPSPNFGIGVVSVTAPGIGWTTCTATLSGGSPSVNGSVIPFVGPITASGNGLAQIVMTNTGKQYTNAQFIITGDGVGAAANATVIPYGALDILNVSPIFGATRPPCNYMPWTEFNARMRLILNNPALPRVWSRYGTSGGSAYLGPPPDQPYVTEFDTAVLPATLVLDTDLDQLQYPFTECVKFYAAYRAKFKQQAYSEGEGYLMQYKGQVLQAKASVGMRRIPNPYAGYTGG